MKNRTHLASLFMAMAVFSMTGVDASAATLITQYEGQTSSASVQPARMNGQAGIAVVFEGTDDLHYYATPEAAPAPHLKLKVSAKAGGATFGPAVYPEYKYFDDLAKGEIEVYVGDFKVFVPITDTISFGVGVDKTTATVTIEGIACTSELCLTPFTKEVTGQVDLIQMTTWPEINFKTAAPQEQSTRPEVTTTEPPAQTAEVNTGLAGILSDWKAAGDSQAAADGSVLWFFLLAILAGLSINIMPCVLPVIPLIIMRLVGQAKESSSRRVALGFSFCGGIVLFFAAFAVISAAIKLSTGVALDLNGIYRNPAAVITLFLFIVFFALVLLDVLIIGLPGSVAGKQGGGGGFAGSIGMGFFAGILSTPCSGAIIGAVLVWAQTQPLAVSSVALVLMGVGMALPYAILISVPKLLDYVPKPGTWMEIFKKTGGFLLLIIAVKFMLAGLTKDHLINVLLYGVIFGFCVWMWGTWVTFSTPKGKKRLVRGIAAALAIATGFWLLPAPQQSQIDWQKYDPAVVQNALENNQPVLLKFTADWCTNCKIVDKNVYKDPETAAFLTQQGFVTIKADTTQSTYQATIDYNAIFKGAGSVPNTVLLNPDNKTITNLRGIFTSEELKEKINEQF
jgi:thiol:disulfide interchange protein